MTDHSRRFTIANVPDPIEIKAEFVYNFFVPDERTNSDGDPRVPGVFSNEQTQRLVKANTLKSEIPRFVNINFKPAQIIEFNNFGDTEGGQILSGFSEADISAEEKITNEPFATSRDSDPDAIKRIAEKLAALSKLQNTDFSSSNQTSILSEKTGIGKEFLQEILSPYNNKHDLQVNSRQQGGDLSLYNIASQLSLNSLISKRVLGIAAMGGDDTSPLSRLEQQAVARKIADVFLSTANSSALTISDFEATLSPIGAPERVPNDEDVRILGAATVGYILVRKQLAPSGKNLNVQTVIMAGKNNTSFIDTKVLYGTKYAYSVRAVYQIDAIVETSEEGQAQKQRITTLIASRPSPSTTVLTEEYEPPRYPDGVFYNFNYDAKRGLIITWQIPSGKQRDTKYFQVFRRESIYVPFRCLAEIDFDDAEVKTLRAERVRPDLSIKSNGPQTIFEDKSFQRDSKEMIYAVCAIDTHGFTSGYSAQTMVGFDKTKNSLTLKNISRPGAPKQYPNFFIDPDLDDNIAVDSFTQDAIFDSGRTRVDIYFTPDAISSKTKDGNVNDIITTDKNQGKYKLHVLNLDLQKSTTAEINIKDLRKM